MPGSWQIVDQKADLGSLPLRQAQKGTPTPRVAPVSGEAGEPAVSLFQQMEEPVNLP